MRFIKFILGVVFFVFFMVFFVQNQAQLATVLELKFNMFTLNWQAQPLPFYIVVLVFFFLGALVSAVAFFVDRVRVGSNCREAQSRAQSLQYELDALKAKQTAVVVAAPAPAPAAEPEAKA
jgi:uncharacterized integral membrane protein